MNDYVKIVKVGPRDGLYPTIGKADTLNDRAGRTFDAVPIPHHRKG